MLWEEKAELGVQSQEAMPETNAAPTQVLMLVPAFWKVIVPVAAVGDIVAVNMTELPTNIDVTFEPPA